MKRFALLLIFTLALPALAAEKTGRLAGTIVSRDASTNRLTVSHGEVSGVMGAMTMPYEVRGQKVTSLPNNGAKISATLHEAEGVYWLTDVKAAAETTTHAPEGHNMQATPQPHEHAG